jgi:hypothetical protein
MRTSLMQVKLYVVSWYVCQGLCAGSPGHTDTTPTRLLPAPPPPPAPPPLQPQPPSPAQLAQVSCWVLGVQLGEDQVMGHLGAK